MPPAVIDTIATIVIDSSGDITVSPDPISTVPGKSVVFVIENNDNQKHRVSVSPFEFENTKATDPKHPIDPFTIFWTDVEKNDVSAIVHHVKGKGHFGGDPKGIQYNYKYSIHSSNTTLDPDIEINN